MGDYKLLKIIYKSKKNGNKINPLKPNIPTIEKVIQHIINNI